LLVEDDIATREYLAQCIASDPRVRLVGACDGVESARHALQALEIDVLVTDLALPDGDGTELIRAVRQEHPNIECMVISVFDSDRRVFAALEAGAHGYLLKDRPALEIVEAICSLVAGGSPISPAIARHILRRWDKASDIPDGTPLTDREKEVLGLFARGATYLETAHALGVTRHTVESHVKSIYRKLEVNSRSAAVFAALQRGLIRPP